MFELIEKDLVFSKVKINAIMPAKETINAGYDIYVCLDEDGSSGK